MIGGTVAGLLVSAGHEVWVANSRGPDAVRDLDARPLASGRRFEPGSPIDNVRLDAAELRAQLTIPESPSAP